MLRRRCANSTAMGVRGCATLRGHDRAPVEKQFSVGETYEGFRCDSLTPIPSLRLTALRFTHNKTQAPFYHFDTDDQNNAFLIGFGTPATSDKGTTHVLEHTVLCGSDKYQVRDPFFHMTRRSLATFMNAMTGADYTLYPFSTMNSKDFDNLLSVYLDAVFRPLLKAEDFRQEGHRVEPVAAPKADGEAPPAIAKKFTDEDGNTHPRTHAINGVVFNEMRGVISEPSRHFLHEMWGSVLPGTHYEYISGGHPRSILDLTHDDVVSYHRQYYHPSNAVTMTYGDLSPLPRMQRLNGYFESFEKQDRQPIPKLAAFDQGPHQKQSVGPTNMMGDPASQKRMVMSYALPPSKLSSGDTQKASKPTMEELVKLHVLDDLLFSGPSAPMHKALLTEKQYGSNFILGSGFAYYLSTQLFSIGVEGIANDRDAKEIEATVLETLRNVCEKGTDQRRVESVVVRQEIQQRHRSANYGLNLLQTLSSLYITTDADPLENVNWLPHLKAIAEQPQKVLLDALESVTLKNEGNRTTLVVTADKEFLPRMQAELDQREERVNKEIHAKGDAHREALAKDHTEWLGKVRAQQDASVLPTLRVSDIPRQGFVEPARETVSAGIDLIPTGTNGLVYLHGQVPFPKGYFDAGSTLPMSPVDEVKFNHNFIGSLGTQKLDVQELDIESSLCCNGINFGLTMNNTQSSRADFVCATGYGFMTTEDRLERALELLRQLLTEPRAVTKAARGDDLEVVRHLVSQVGGIADDTISSISQAGHAFAMAAATKHFSRAHALTELWSGLSHCDAMTETLGKIQAQQALWASGDEAMASSATDFVEGLADRRAVFMSELQDRLRTQGTQLWAACEPAAAGRVGKLLEKFRNDVTGGASIGHSAIEQSMVHALGGDASAAAPAAGRKKVPMQLDCSFVGYAVPTGLSFNDPDHFAVSLGCRILQSEMLHRAVREEGGAYGAMAAASAGGLAGALGLQSYRDPNPDGATRAFDGAGAWLADAANITEERLEQAKLRTFAGVDAPCTPDQYGARWFKMRYTPEQRAAAREVMLAMTTKDIVERVPKYFDSSKASVTTLAPKSSETETTAEPTA